MIIQQIIVGGLCGQGVEFAGRIIGKAAVYDAKCVTLKISRGPKAHGGGCAAQIFVGSRSIDCPYLTCSDVLIAFSQEANAEYAGKLADAGKLFYESELVVPEYLSSSIRLFPIPCIRIAEDIWKSSPMYMAMNIVMLGFFAKTNSVVSLESLQEAIQVEVPPKFKNISLAAFEEGYSYQPAEESILAFPRFQDGEIQRALRF